MRASVNGHIVRVTAYRMTNEDDWSLSDRLESTLEIQDSKWGPWTSFGLADSPDNYPEGRDITRRGPNGEYTFAWASQAEYVAYQTERVQSIGGEVQGGSGDSLRFRLPSAEPPGRRVSERGQPQDVLRPTEVTVRARWFPSPYKKLNPLRDLSGMAIVNSSTRELTVDGVYSVDAIVRPTIEARGESPTSVRDSSLGVAGRGRPQQEKPLRLRDGRETPKVGWVLPPERPAVT